MSLEEKAKIIRGIKVVAEIKCKYDMQCHAYFCKFQHSTPNKISPGAIKILEKIAKTRKEKNFDSELNLVGKQLENLKLDTPKVHDELMCAIWLDNINEATACTPCMHTFCKSCIE